MTDQLTLTNLIEDQPPPVTEGEMAITELLAHYDGILGMPPSDEFVDNIRRLGQLDPILLNQIKTDSGRYKYEIIAGKRRIQALQTLGKSTVRYVLYITDSLTANAMAVSSNAVRSSNPAAELDNIQHIIDLGRERGVEVTLSDIAAATGMPYQTVVQRMILLHLPEPIKEGLRSGKVTKGVAKKIATLPKVTQERLAEVAAEGKKITATMVHNERSAAVKKAQMAIPEEMFDVPDEPNAIEPDYKQKYETLKVLIVREHEAYLRHEQEEWEAMHSAIWQYIA